MPRNESLETTKRKFYKILDNISGTRVDRPTPGSTANASSTTLAEPSMKRLRFLSSRGSDREKTRPVSMPVTPGPLTPAEMEEFAQRLPEPVRKEFLSRADLRFLAGERRRKKQHEEAEKLPPSTYAPYDQDLFLERLKTFADMKLWTPKPEAIGEVEWAKRGWFCEAKDAVFCRACEKRVVVWIMKDEDKGEVLEWWTEEAETELVDKYKDLIVDGHDENCGWRQFGSKGKLSQP